MLEHSKRTTEVFFDPKSERQKIALLLPCLNEELTLAKVIKDFKAQIPGLEIFVFDNGSTDRSAEIARRNGATVISVPKRGKGNVVKKMFEVVEADLYIMVDSDDTYDASRIHELIEPVAKGGIDMTVGTRIADSTKAFRKFHRLGNGLIMSLINLIFQTRLKDICSGYRVMSRYFVKNIPLIRHGFEVETELTVYSVINGFSIQEIPLPYGTRPKDSFSKLRTFSDGYKVLLAIVWLMRDTRPLLFFGALSVLLFFGVTLPLAFIANVPSFVSTTLSAASIGLFVAGLVLNTLQVRFAELQVLMRRTNVKPVLHKEIEIPVAMATESRQNYATI